MAVWSTVAFRELSQDLRLDAEHYRPDVLDLRAAIAASPYTVQTVETLSRSVINFGAYSLCNDILFQDDTREKDGLVRFVTAQDIQDGFIDYTNVRWIPETQHDGLLRKSQVRSGQVLVAMAARLGHAAVYEEKEPLNSSQDIAKITIRDTDQISPHYLASYINSNIGRQLLLAAQTGSVQQHTNLGRIKHLPVVIPPEGSQADIARTYVAAVTKRQTAFDAMRSAEDMLVGALELHRLDLSPQLTVVRPFSSLAAAMRFDAEYFSPRYQKVLSRLGRDDMRLRDVANLAERRFRPKRGAMISYIEIGSLTGDGEPTAEVLDAIEAPSRAQWIVRRGDVITSTVRPIRRLSALITPEQDGYVCSSGFAVLQPTSIEPEILLTYLRLPIICEILDLHTTASMYPAIPVDSLMSIPFALPPTSVRQAVVSAVQQAINDRREANRLMAKAKNMVQDLILAGPVHSDK
jgi:hypothetical protein